MNATMITALSTGIPAIIGAITALVVALKGGKNVHALGQQVVHAMTAHNVLFHHNNPNATGPVLLGPTMEGQPQMQPTEPTSGPVDTDVRPPADVLTSAPAPVPASAPLPDMPAPVPAAPGDHGYVVTSDGHVFLVQRTEQSSFTVLREMM